MLLNEPNELEQGLVELGLTTHQLQHFLKIIFELFLSLREAETIRLRNLWGKNGQDLLSLGNWFVE